MPLGVYITDVSNGGGAEEAGMTKGGVITELNGTTIDSMKTLQEQLKFYAKGETVKLTVQVPGANGEYTAKSYDVRLGAKSE